MDNFFVPEIGMEKIRDIVSVTKDSLKENNLLDTYDVLKLSCDSEPTYCGYLTRFFMSKGIDPIDYFDNLIPYGCYYDAEVSPKLLINGDRELNFYKKPSIKILMPYSFGYQPFDTVDLTGVEYVLMNSFVACPMLKTVIVDGSQFMDVKPFERTFIRCNKLENLIIKNSDQLSRTARIKSWFNYFYVQMQ